MSGTEILGVIASVVQVAELGGRLSVKLCTFCHRFKNANKALQGLSKDVALTCNVLRQLGDSLKQDDLATLCSPDAFETAQDVLKECESVFQNLERQVEQHYADPSSKSRIERASKKIWFLMNEPHLDSVAGNLERLKSTMLLMLNVIIYAGQIRSRREASEIQDQRNLLLVLASEKLESERNFERFAKSMQYINLNALDSKAQPHIGVNVSSETDDELYHYYKMVQYVLGEIDTVQSFLDSSRYNRVRNGFVGLHTTEAPRLQQVYGPRAALLFNDLPDIKNQGSAQETEIPPAQLAPSIQLNPQQSNERKPPDYERLGNLPEDHGTFNLDFSSGGPDILESFDFDAFLNADNEHTLIPINLNPLHTETHDAIANLPSEPWTGRKKSKKRKISQDQFDPIEVPQLPDLEQDGRRKSKKRLADAELSRIPFSNHAFSAASSVPASLTPEAPEALVLRWTTLEKPELS